MQNERPAEGLYQGDGTKDVLEQKEQEQKSGRALTLMETQLRAQCFIFIPTKI